jgi:sulfonate transport system permease protein
LLPARSKVVRTAFKLAAHGSLLNDLAVSLLRGRAGFVIGGTIGFALGTAVEFSRIAQALIDRSIQVIRAIPFLALLLLVIVRFGVGESEKVFLVALGVTLPIYISTTFGSSQLDSKRPELGRVRGLGT